MYFNNFAQFRLTRCPRCLSGRTQSLSHSHLHPRGYKSPRPDEFN